MARKEVVEDQVVAEVEDEYTVNEEDEDVSIESTGIFLAHNHANVFFKLAFIPVEELQKAGINAAEITKLRKDGICTIQGVTAATKRHLLRIKGLSEVRYLEAGEVKSSCFF